MIRVNKTVMVRNVDGSAAASARARVAAHKVGAATVEGAKAATAREVVAMVRAALWAPRPVSTWAWISRAGPASASWAGVKAGDDALLWAAVSPSALSCNGAQFGVCTGSNNNCGDNHGLRKQAPYAQTCRAARQHDRCRARGHAAITTQNVWPCLQVLVLCERWREGWRVCAAPCRCSTKHACVSRERDASQRVGMVEVHPPWRPFGHDHRGMGHCAHRRHHDSERS